MSIDNDIAVHNAISAREKLRADLAEAERARDFEELRISIISDTLEMLEGKAPAEPRQRQTRKRRGNAQNGPAEPPEPTFEAPLTELVREQRG